MPSEATFSRAFAEFAASELASRLHAALVEPTLQDQLAGHVSRDSTAIPVRDRPARKRKQIKAKRKGAQRPTQRRRLERQGSMTLEELLADPPTACGAGVKRNAKGHREGWQAYKLHIDAIDGGLPVSWLLTSALPHDNQAAVPLARLTAGRADFP